MNFIGKVAFIVYSSCKRSNILTKEPFLYVAYFHRRWCDFHGSN